MFAAFRGELFKVVRRPGVWVLVIVLLVLAILIGYAITWLIYTFPPKGASQGLPAGTTLSDFKVTLYPANFVRETLGQWGVLGGVFALIVGVLLQGSEYGWGTIKTLYTQRSGRLTMLFGKVAALAVVVFVMVIALFGVDAGSSTVVALIDGKTISYPDATTIVKAIVACFLIFGFWAMFGLALATLFQQSALAIGLGTFAALLFLPVAPSLALDQPHQRRGGGALVAAGPVNAVNHVQVVDHDGRVSHGAHPLGSSAEQGKLYPRRYRLGSRRESS